jgi:hypothetical protein
MSVRVLLCAATIILLTSCVPTGGNVSGFFRSGCTDNNDCPTNLECLESLCTDDDHPTWPLLLRFRPPVNAAAGDGEVSNVVFGESPILNIPDVKLPVPVEIIGSARLPSGTNLPVKVTARAQSNTYPQLTYVGETTDDVNGPRFALRLPAVWPGEDSSLVAVIYRLTVVPKEADRYPPWTVNPFQIPAEGGRVNLDLPNPETQISYSAKVLQSNTNLAPVPQLRVYAVDNDGRTISTDVRTDQLGQFTIHFWATSAGMTGTLRIRPTPESGPYPSLDRPVTVPDSTAMPSDEESVTMTVGNTGTVEWFSGIVRGSDFITGARLHFRGEIGNGVYRYDVVQTNDLGHFRALLYPGSYTVDIVPPINSRYRITRVTEPVESGQEIEFRPQKRANVSGRILAPDGEPIANATVEATLQKASFADPRLSRENEVSPSRRQRIQTNNSGGYVLQLDPGSHDLRIVPPTVSGLPDFRQRLEITALDTILTDVDIQIPPASGLQVRVLDRHDQAVPGTVVEVWRTDKSPPELTARGRTGSAGQVLLRLPNTH